jgi:hypothetical protein
VCRCKFTLLILPPQVLVGIADEKRHSRVVGEKLGPVCFDLFEPPCDMHQRTHNNDQSFPTLAFRNLDSDHTLATAARSNDQRSFMTLAKVLCYAIHPLFLVSITSFFELGIEIFFAVHSC